MEKLDVIILSGVAATLFIIFIVVCFKEFSKMSKEDYVYDAKQKKFGRDAIYDMIERLFNDTKKTKKERVKLFKTLEVTLSDMESDGMRFSDEVKTKMEKEKEELFCEYSGLPSPKAYEEN